jgi:hypothetical protein
VHVVSGKTSQKFWNIVDCHVIDATLHGAKQVMVKLRHVNSLVKHKVVYLPILTGFHPLWDTVLPDLPDFFLSVVP